MQFFPADIFNASAALGLGKIESPLGDGNLFAHAASAASTDKQSDSFQNIFANLSAYNEQNTPGAAITMRSSRDDSSYFQSDDFKFLKEKLVELGVPAKTVESYFTKLAQNAANPTIGQLRNTLSQMLGGSGGPEMDKQEQLQFRDLLSKMGFSNEELAEIESMLERGSGLDILKAIQQKLQGKEFELGKDDLDLLVKACKLDGEALESVTQFWDKSGLVEDDALTIKQDIFQKLFGTSMASMERDGQNLLTLSENLEEGIQAMLSNKKQQAGEPVADLRGSALTERSETMARIIATMLGEEDEDDEKPASPLIEDKGGDKPHKKGSIAASLLNNDKGEKLGKEEAESAARAVLRGEADEENKFAPKSSAAKNAREADPKAAYATAGQQKDASQAAKAGQTSPTGQENSGRAPAFAENTSDAGSAGKQNDPKAQQDIFGAQRQGASEADAAKAALNAKVHDGGAVFSLFGQGENSSSPAQQLNNAKTEMYHERIFEQVERGIIKNAADGSKQIILRLDPPELGKLTLSLSMAQGELKAVIRTESAATTQVVSEQLAQLKQSLEEQGFKVSSLEVETRAQSHAGTDNWNGAAQHNQEQEMLEQARFLRLARSRAGEGETLARSMQNVEQPASISASGLHIIA